MKAVYGHLTPWLLLYALFWSRQIILVLLISTHNISSKATNHKDRKMALENAENTELPVQIYNKKQEKLLNFCLQFQDLSLLSQQH